MGISLKPVVEFLPYQALPEHISALEEGNIQAIYILPKAFPLITER